MTHCCATITLTLVGSPSARMGKVGGGIAPSAAYVGGMVSSASLTGDTSCKMTHICRGSVRAHYLEINPKIVWVYMGFAENDVYSNTSWNVD